jgi:peptide/nickel transport system substrate-binding protein
MSDSSRLDVSSATTWRRLLAVAVAFVLLASGCGSGGSDSPSTAASRPDVEADAGPPRSGGALTVGLTGETNSYNPSIGQWSAASYLVANAIFDPLAAVGPDGNPQPYLAQAITPNDDFTTWTITLRPGIEFHDGEPLDAAAVAKNLNGSRSAGLTSQALVSVVSVDVTDAQTVVVKMNKPWSTFPAILTLQTGYMAAPAMLDDPAGANAEPIGTGPFMFADRQVGAYLKTKRNPTYWQKDSSGTALPYLDALDFNILPDGTSRSAALDTGDVGVAQVVTPEGLKATAEEADRGEVQVLNDSNQETDETVLGFNTSKPPFDDPLARQAIAAAIDQDSLAQIAYQGALPGAWGMFEEGSPYYISPEEAGYPSHDPDKARQLVADYQEKHGKPLEFSYLVPADPQYLAIGQAYQAELAQYGIKLHLESTEQTTLITRVIATGEFESAGFVMWSSPSVGQGYIFLATKANPDGLSLNYPRFDDPELTAAMDDFRATTDQAERIEAMTRVQQQLAQNLQVLFLVHNHLAVAYRNNVHGLRAGTFPDTDVDAYAPYPITPFLTHAWTDPA